MLTSIEKNSRILAVFAVVCTAIVSTVHLLTADKIEQQAKQELLTTLGSIIEPSRHNNVIYQDCLLVTTPELGGEQLPVYLAKKDDKLVAAALTAIAPDGYNGNIFLLVAVNTDGSISGVRTLKHQETPGLGDKIEKRRHNWIDSFIGKKVTDEDDTRWAVKKDGGMFDQFTGATITPRAVVKAVTKTVRYFEKNQDKLVEQVSQNQNSCAKKA